jgi:hypothetical protein
MMPEEEELVFEADEGSELDEEQKKAVDTVLDAWEARMKKLTDDYIAEAEEVVRAEAGPVVRTRRPYPWWNILLAGPFQPAIAGGPQKNFMANQFAWVAGALWLNPAFINWGPPGPNAATVMAGWNMRINFHTINLTTVAAGPTLRPVRMHPIFRWPGPPWFKRFYRRLGPGIFPVPQQGVPDLYELNVTADISGPAPQPFFAGYATWVFDPDVEPAVWPPRMPGANRPTVFPHWQYEIPMRFLVYTA